MNPFSDEELELIKKALGTARLPPREGKVTEAQLMKKINDLQKQTEKHPFEEPRLMPWIKKSMS